MNSIEGQWSLVPTSFSITRTYDQEDPTWEDNPSYTVVWGIMGRVIYNNLWGILRKAV